jgi:hypothetical protein
MTPGFEALLEAVRETTDGTLVVTGAGVSLASGIPTFRGTDPGAVWANEVHGSLDRARCTNSVGITQRLLSLGLKRGAKVFSVDPAGTAPAKGVTVIAERAEELLPRLIHAAGMETPPP